MTELERLEAEYAAAEKRARAARDAVTTCAEALVDVPVTDPDGKSFWRHRYGVNRAVPLSEYERQKLARARGRKPLR